MKFRHLMAMAFFCLSPAVFAQASYPTKPIRLVVPFAAGGATDNFARPLAQQLSIQLGQQMIVDNRAGAGGVIGSANAAGSPPDGYTLLATTDTSVYLTTQVVKNGSYDPVKGLVPVIDAVVTSTAIAVHPSLPVHNMKELIEYSKKNSEPIPYVTAGVGSLHHVAGESLAVRTGAKFLHVPYKGGSPAITDLLAGQVKMGILILTNFTPYFESGKLRPIAVIEGQRSKFWPDIPTIAESGVPGFALPATGLGFWAPAGTPPAIVQRLSQEVQKAVAVPQVKATLEKAGYEVHTVPAAEFGVLAPKLYATYKTLVEETKVTPQ